MREHFFNHDACITDGTIDFAARRKTCDTFLDKLRKGLTRFHNEFEHQQPGNHAAVAVEKFAEVMMCTHLAAVNSISRAHHFLDKRVAGFALHRDATKLLHHGFRVPDEAWIVNYSAAGFFNEEGFSQ